jgi:DNA-binding transcriptional regulator WhiA
MIEHRNTKTLLSTIKLCRNNVNLKFKKTVVKKIQVFNIFARSVFLAGVVFFKLTCECTKIRIDNKKN